MRELTMVLPHYMNPGMFSEQQKVWASYPPALRDKLHVVLVDDCSPEGQRPSPESVTVDGLGSLRIYRLLKKKRWNWLACRNLGAKVATTKWLLLTDIDHGVPASTLERIMTGELHKNKAYRFKRVDAPRPWPYDLSECTEYKPHNDSWLLTRDMFFSDGIGGYDETLAGNYGTSGEFKDRVLATVSAHVVLPEVLIRYPREVIADASTHPSVYTRKNDPENEERLQRLKEKRARNPYWKPQHGLFPYEEVYSSLGAEVCS